MLPMLESFFPHHAPTVESRLSLLVVIGHNKRSSTPVNEHEKVQYPPGLRCCRCLKVIHEPIVSFIMPHVHQGAGCPYLWLLVTINAVQPLLMTMSEKVQPLLMNMRRCNTFWVCDAADAWLHNPLMLPDHQGAACL